MAKSKYIEAFEEQYTKKDGKSVLRYKAPDGKWRYINGNKDDKGEKDPSLAPSDSGNVTFTDGSGNEHELITSEGFGDALNEALPSALAKAQVIETTWQELKDKRDNGQLIAGSLYRITDYNCTTTQENTQSAGHQFDIVLLALSEDKLAEEGWAMEHPADIWTVYFDSGMAIDEPHKCYVYKIREGTYNVVSVDTLLGMTDVDDYDSIDFENKTMRLAYSFNESMTEENLTYNYFQNSNLSAWKVWYCLGNDTARFAWADDSVDEGSPAFITTSNPKGMIITLYRYSAGDSNNLFAWKSEGALYPWYTASQTPSVGDTIYDDANGTDSGNTVNSYTPAHEGTGLPNGRGVIYRLIDEWNNDVSYDFKNIQFNKEMSNSTMWCYTFTNIDDGGNLYDCSTYNDGFVYNNFIEKTIDIMEGEECLSNNVLIHPASCCIKCSTNNLLIMSLYITLINSSGCEINTSHDGLELINCHDFTPSDGYGIYLNNKKVLTEE